MAYHVEIDEALVHAYLLDPGRNLSQSDIETLLNFLEVELGRDGDFYRNEPERRCSLGSSNFAVALLFRDSAGNLRHFRFIVSDAAASYGVLRVRFAEEL